MMSQVTAKEILTKVGTLSKNTDYKNVWLKRDVNLNEKKNEGQEIKLRKKTRKVQEMEKRSFSFYISTGMQWKCGTEVLEYTSQFRV